MLGSVTDIENMGLEQGEMKVVFRFGHSHFEFQTAVVHLRRDTIQVAGGRAWGTDHDGSLGTQIGELQIKEILKMSQAAQLFICLKPFRIL